MIKVISAANQAKNLIFFCRLKKRKVIGILGRDLKGNGHLPPQPGPATKRPET
jgi:hypothetical protein